MDRKEKLIKSVNDVIEYLEDNLPLPAADAYIGKLRDGLADVSNYLQSHSPVPDGDFEKQLMKLPPANCGECKFYKDATHQCRPYGMNTIMCRKEAFQILSLLPKQEDITTKEYFKACEEVSKATREYDYPQSKAVEWPDIPCKSCNYKSCGSTMCLEAYQEACKSALANSRTVEQVRQDLLKELAEQGYGRFVMQDNEGVIPDTQVFQPLNLDKE